MNNTSVVKILTENEIRQALKEALTVLRKKAERSSISSVLHLLKDIAPNTLNDRYASDEGPVEVLYENKDGSKVWLMTLKAVDKKIEQKEQKVVISEKNDSNIKPSDESK